MAIRQLNNLISLAFCNGALSADNKTARKTQAALSQQNPRVGTITIRAHCRVKGSKVVAATVIADRRLSCMRDRDNDSNLVRLLRMFVGILLGFICDT